MMKTSRSIEITIISAEDLRINRRSIKKNAFVTVQSDSNNFRSTSVDSEGGSYPSWNEKLDLPLPYNAQFITVVVQCKNGKSARTVGTANIPVSDFIGNCVPENYLHFLSYRLREHDGERNGIINLSIRLNSKVSKYNDHRPMMMMTRSNQTDYKNFGGIAVGIPVSIGYSV